MNRSLIVLLLFGLAACNGDGDGDAPSDPTPQGEDTAPEGKTPPSDETPEPETTGPTWHADVAPIVEQHCGGCHNQDGIGPFVLTDYASFQAVKVPAIDAIASGRMPPWQPSSDCRSYRHERVLSGDEKAVIAQWAADGMPEGELPDTVEQPQTEELPEPSAVGVATDAYVPDDSRPDDYRCFPLNVEFPEDTYLAGSDVVPDQRAIVHHVLVYVVSPGDVAALLQRDERDAGPGYTCYGGPGAGTVPSPVAAWVPGSTANMMDEGTMQFIAAGSRLVMQIHYNVLTAEAVPDQTALNLYYWDEPQPFEAVANPQPKVDLFIPAGDDNVTEVAEFAYRGDEPVTLAAMGPHMHVLGKSIRVDLIREDGDEECLVDIPDWDFNWQQNYRFEEGEEVIVNPGDRFRLTCVYDNSAENQPVVNGERLTPRDVTWGEGTLDEMCLNFITLVKPFEPPTGRCGGLDACRDGCSDPDGTSCLLDCGTADQACGRCVVGAMIGQGGCARDTCIRPLAAAQDCFVDCIVESLTSGSLAACMADTCPAEYDDLAACMDPLLEAGACDGAIGACVE